MPMLPYFPGAFNRQDGGAPARANASGPIGITSLAVGGVSLLVAWIPYLGMLAVPVALGGAIAGIVGIIVGRVAGQRRVFLPLGGFLLCLISIAVSYGSTYAWQHRAGAPGQRPWAPPPPPPVDMRGVSGPFVPTLPKPLTQPTFVMPRFDRPTTEPTPPEIER